MSSFDIHPPNMRMFHEWAIRTQLHTDIVPDLSHVIYKSIFFITHMHTQHCESILCPSLQSPINSVFSLYLNNDRNETISTVINDLTGEEGDERITRACTFLSLLVSFLLSHRSLSFISYNNVLHFPLDTIPQRIMGLLGNLS